MCVRPHITNKLLLMDRQSANHTPSRRSPLGPTTDAMPMEKASGMSCSQKPFMQRWLIWPKLLFFLLTVLIYLLQPLKTNFFIKDLGMTKIGVCFVGVAGGINFFGALLWTALADRTNKHRMILTVNSILYMIFTTLNLLKPFDYKTQQNLALVYVLAVNTLSNLFVSALFPLMDSLMITMLTQDPTLTKEMFGRQRLFSTIGHAFGSILSQVLIYITIKVYGHEWYPILYIVMPVFGAAFIASVWLGLPSSADVGAKAKLHGSHHGAGGGEKAKAADDKGKERLEVATPIMTTTEAADDEAGSQGDNKATTHTFLHSSISQSLPTAPTPAPPAAMIELGERKKGSGFMNSPAMVLLTNVHFLFFMLFILTVGLLRNILTVWRTYLSLKIQQDLILNSLPTIARAIAESIVLFFGKQWIKTFGVYWVLIFSQMTSLGQVFGYAFLPKSPEWYYATYPLEILKGLTSGLLTSAAVRIASDMAPKGCENTAQGLYSGMFSGISVSVGNLLSALIFFLQPKGSGDDVQFLFFWTAIISLIITVLLMAKFIFYDRVMSIPGLPRKYAAPGKPL